MTEWEEVDISIGEPESNIESLATAADGLSANVESLHSNFWQDAAHLSEVEDRHVQVLINAGMIPEDHIASTEPTRKLSWFVNELNGRIDPDGLSIPVKGLEVDDIKIYQKTDQESLVRLKFVEKNGQELERFIDLKSESDKYNIKANFYNDRLYLRW